MTPQSRVLFILKRRQDYHAVKHSHIGMSTGLYNSAKFMDEMLRENGIESKMVVVVDNNCIDREVTQFKPTHVIIEALWVVPTKFEVLTKLHPKVKWIIRLHSEIPFLANEGMSMDWLGDYVTYDNVIIGVNAPRALDSVKYFLSSHRDWDKETTDKRVIYLPNYFAADYKNKKFEDKEHIDIACFGAIRPLKNHLIQAIAAVEFAERIGKKLHFHVNSGRLEGKGEPVFHNLKHLFTHLYDNGHELYLHEWRPRAEFLELCGKMDMGLQVSFSETFNIVSADLLAEGVPIVGSSEIPWMSWLYTARATETKEIVKALQRAYYLPQVNVWLNRANLKAYAYKTQQIWVNYFKHQCHE
jgi:hypothetical protein